jgi:uncharacterized OsmC-like protein
MARMKKVSIEAKLDQKFRVDVKAGDRTLCVDQPGAAGGTDAGPNPIEYMFASLAGCIATAARIMANQKRIKLNGMDIKVEGSFDTDIILGRSKENRAGVTGIEVLVSLDTEMTPEQKEAFIHELETRCPVSDNLLNTTPLSIKLA